MEPKLLDGRERMKSGSDDVLLYPVFMAALTMRHFRRTRFGSSRPAVAVEELCMDCELSEYVERLDEDDDQRSCVRVSPASGL